MNRVKSSSRTRTQYDTDRGPMTPERLAYGQFIYHSLYDYATACGFSSNSIYILCIKWKMTPSKWFKAKKHPNQKWRLTPSRVHGWCERPTTPWHLLPMYKSKFED